MRTATRAPPLFLHKHTNKFIIGKPSQSELGAAPVTALAVVTDGIVRAQANPLGQRAVLLHLLSQLLLDQQRLVRRLRHCQHHTKHSRVISDMRPRTREEKKKKKGLQKNGRARRRELHSSKPAIPLPHTAITLLPRICEASRCSAEKRAATAPAARLRHPP